MNYSTHIEGRSNYVSVHKDFPGLSVINNHDEYSIHGVSCNHIGADEACDLVHQCERPYNRADKKWLLVISRDIKFTYTLTN